MPVLTWRMAFYHLAYNIDDNVGMLPSCTHTNGMVADLVLTPTSCADCWALRIVPLALVPSPYVTVCWCELRTCLVMCVELLGYWVHAHTGHLHLLPRDDGVEEDLCSRAATVRSASPTSSAPGKCFFARRICHCNWRKTGSWCRCAACSLTCCATVLDIVVPPQN